MNDELNLSPFDRRHIGTHGAFLQRTNHEHVEETKRRILERRLAEVRIEFGEAASVRLARAA